ncbi:MAG TPA: NAD-dependent epimerase, partial [Dongiaceae bacterium]
MHVMIIGAAGMIGRKLTEKLAATGRLGERAIARLTLVDVIEPQAPTGFAGKTVSTTADLSAPGAAA